ncbi:MAG: TraB/GumN family protein [Crocinitomicaceae bacterium]|nr:TraB/GumN family protein [Crocinitomicaceae bacterium]
MKLTRTITTIFIMVITLFSYGQDSNSLLWKISGKNLKQESYLYGTMHKICADSFEFKPKVKEALGKSSQLFLELDMDDPQFSLNAQTVMLNPDMANISDQFEQEQLDTLNSFLKANYDADMTQFGIMKPFGLISLITNSCFECENTVSIEAELIGYAQEQKWEIYGLEELQDQIGIFDQVAVAEQISWVNKYILELDEMKADLVGMMEAYENEDINYFLNSTAESPEFLTLKEDLLDNRNKSWIKPIIKNAKKQTTFFAVGTAHLSGENGLINLLRAKGYTVEPILD